MPKSVSVAKFLAKFQVALSDARHGCLGSAKLIGVALEGLLL